MLIACAELPLHFVFGNHDADGIPHLLRAAAECGAVCLGYGGVVEMAGKTIGIVHGHMTTDVRRVRSLRSDFMLSGHDHIASDRLDGSIRRINPGALYRADRFTVALLDVTTGDVRFLEVG